MASNTKPGFIYNNVAYVTPKIVFGSSTVDPLCIVQHKTISPGGYVTYKFYECNKDGGGSGTFALDSDGIPTVTGSYGSYGCTIQFNGGGDEVEYIQHANDGTLESTFTTWTKDSEGFNTFTAHSGAKIIYVDPTLGSDTNFGPTGNGTDHYSVSNPPTGGIENPSSVNAVQTILKAWQESADGDWILFKRGETVSWSGASFNIKAGKSATEWARWGAYGTGARPILTRTDDGLSLVINESWSICESIDFYPPQRDPDNGSFAGWGSVGEEKALQVYSITGGITGCLVENCYFRFFEEGINGIADGVESALFSDVTIRRNIFEKCYTEIGRSQGMWCARKTVLFEENYMLQNGYLIAPYDASGTATSGGTTTLTETGAFTGLDLTNVRLDDDTNGGNTTIVSNTNDTITFNAAANVDFTGGGNYTYGPAGDTAQGQATNFNHNTYWTQTKGAIIRDNVYYEGASQNHKFTAETSEETYTEELGDEQTYDVSIYRNIHIGGTTSMSPSGNDDLGIGSRYKDMRYQDNIHYTVGNANITKLNYAWVFTARDWNGGVIGGNIMLKTGTADINNVFGIEMSGHMQNLQVARNVLFDIGKASTSYSGNEGGIYFDNGFPGKLTAESGSGTSLTDTGAFTDPDVDNRGVVDYDNVGWGRITSHTNDSITFEVLSGTMDFTGGGSYSWGENIPAPVNVSVIGNYIQNQNTDAPCYAVWPGGLSSRITLADNKYFSTRASTLWFGVDGTLVNNTAWEAETGETGATYTSVTFQDSARTIETYQTSIGETATVAAFIDNCKLQDKGAWDINYEPKKMVAYFKAGFRE